MIIERITGNADFSCSRPLGHFGYTLTLSSLIFTKPLLLEQRKTNFLKENSGGLKEECNWKSSFTYGQDLQKLIRMISLFGLSNQSLYP